MQGQLSDTDIDSLLATEVFGHLGCTDGHKPYVVPMAYVYRDNVLYGQTAEGKKIDMLRANPLVCFQVENHREREWKSAICWGSFEELEFDKLHTPDMVAVATLLTERIGGIQDNVGISIPFSFEKGASAVTVNGKKSTLFRIVVKEKTGRWYRTEKN